MNFSSQEEIIFEKNQCQYTSNYCEENVYLLCEKFIKISKLRKNAKENMKEKAYAVFITNPQKKTFIKYQNQGNKLKNNLTIWDYHVIFLHKKEEFTKVSSFFYDFDSIFDFPVNFEKYYKNALEFEMKGKLESFYRICECEQFVKEFASDRSHMLVDKKKGIYQSPPPKYPCFVNEKKEVMNLHKYLDLQIKQENYGIVLNSSEFASFCNEKL